MNKQNLIDPIQISQQLVNFPDQLPTIVKVFSARVNSRALFRIVEVNSSPNVIDCLHGIRCLSLMWVVFCHQYVMAALASNINIFHAISVRKYKLN